MPVILRALLLLCLTASAVAAEVEPEPLDHGDLKEAILQKLRYDQGYFQRVQRLRTRSANIWRQDGNRRSSRFSSARRCVTKPSGQLLRRPEPRLGLHGRQHFGRQRCRLKQQSLKHHSLKRCPNVSVWRLPNMRRPRHTASNSRCCRHTTPTWQGGSMGLAPCPAIGHRSGGRSFQPPTGETRLRRDEQ